MSTNQCQSSMYTSSPCESIASDDLVLDFNRNDSSVSLELDNDSRLANSHRTSNCTLHSNFVSGSLSPCSAISSSPFRSSRNSNINSPFDNSFSDSGIRLDQNTYQHLFQDIVSIKTLLLRLKRVLNQNELQINLSNPSIKYYDSEEQDQLMDLKRQLILLQQEMEEKNRKICILETQIERYSEKNLNASIDLSSLEKSTSATQTERIKT
nr:PREDICTED: serine-rich coiled-coil domain-containing protein 2-like [Bemisia tabaci]